MKRPSDIPSTNPATTDYPYGILRDDYIEGDRTGTPIRADWQSDLWYSKLAVLNRAGITPNGVAETITVSQFADAIETIHDNASTINSGTLPINQVPTISYAKIQDVSATDKILGRVTAGAGDIEEIACTAAGRAILDDVDASAQRATLGLGTAATTAATDYGTAANQDILLDFRAYDATRAYALNDPVFYNGVPYKSLQAANTNHTPDTEPTWWVVTGGGSGGAENFLTNPLQSSNTTGWERAGNASIAWTTGKDIYDGGSLAITKTAGTAGTVITYLNEIMQSQLNQAWVLKLTAWIDTGATLVADDIFFELFDGATTIFVGSSSISTNNFITINLPIYPTNVVGSNWRLLIQFKSAAVCVMRIADISVAPQQILSVPAVSGWATDNTVLFSNVALGTGGTSGYRWRRVGNSIEIRAHFIIGTGGTITGVVGLGLPAGLTINHSELSRLSYEHVGSTSGYDYSATTYYQGTVQVSISTSVVNFAFHGSTSVVSGNFPFTWSVNDELYTTFTVPVSQWSSSIQVSAEAVEYVSNDGSGGIAAGATYSTGMQRGVEGSLFVAVNSTTTTGNSYTRYDVDFAQEIKACDSLDIEILDPSSTAVWISSIYASDFAQKATMGTASYGMSLIKVTSRRVGVIFGNAGRRPSSTYGAAGNNWSDLSAFRWRVVKRSGGSLAEVPPVVRAEYINITATAQGAITNFQNKIEDTHNAVTVGANWKFTAPIAGVYDVKRIGYTVGSSGSMLLYKNGVLFRYMGQTLSVSIGGVGACTVRLSVGDYIDFRCDSTSSQAADVNIWCSITRIGS